MKKITAMSLAGISGLLVAGISLSVIGNVRGVTSSKRSTQVAMSHLQLGLELHLQEYGALPATTESPEIFKILTGRNPRQAQFCSATDAEHTAGQFMDGWERPYVFQKTTDNIVIRSAGKDGVYYTEDDLTLDALDRKPNKASSVGR